MPKQRVTIFLLFKSFRHVLKVVLEVVYKLFRLHYFLSNYEYEGVSENLKKID